MKSFHIIQATGGFRGHLWQVVPQDDEPKYVHALSNYDAADACGYRFAEVHVHLMVPQIESNGR